MKNFRRIENKEELEKIISRVLFSTFFHSLQWQEFLEKEFKWLKFEHYLYKDEAILPLTRFKVFGKEKLVSLPFCEYGGPLPLKQGIDFNEFRENILSEFNGNIKIKFHPKILSFFKISKSEEDKFFYDTLSYQIGNLSGAKEQELFQSFRLSIKQRIKKGLDENLTIDNCKTEQDLRDFYRVYVKSMKKNMALCYPFKIFEFLWQKSLKSELVEILIIKHSERVIAGILVVFYSGFAHYFLSGADYKYIEKNKLNPIHFVLWEEIKKIINFRKAETFDFGATRIETGLEEFKRGWGTVSFPIIKLEVGSEGSEKIRTSKLRNILSFLPDFVLRLISLQLIKYKL